MFFTLKKRMFKYLDADEKFTWFAKILIKLMSDRRPCKLLNVQECKRSLDFKRSC